jgi:ABC-type antimicrobial peptide transport system permease subunit
VYSIINILGLTVGMVCCILILLWVQDELSYDSFHANGSELHLVAQHHNYSTGRISIDQTPGAVANVLKKDYPEIVNAARLLPSNSVLEYKGKNFIERVHFADPSILEMFTFPLMKGDPKRALIDLHSIVMTEEMGKKYFGNEDPLYKIIRFHDKYDLTVTGVLKNIPRNSSIKFNFLLPIEFQKEVLGIELETWGVNRMYTFVLLQKGVNFNDLSRKISDLFKRYMSKENIREIFLHPLHRMHLYSVDGNGGEIKYVRLFSLVAFFVLIIACINFMNLSTARLTHRTKEIGLRKVVGANRIQLIKQYLAESMGTVLIAIILAIMLVALILPEFSALSGKQLSMNFFTNIYIILGLIFITLFTGILSGSYPALYLSSFHPARVFKGIIKSGKGAALFRRVLVVIQFAISIVLVISTTVIYQQLEFLRTKELGFDKEHIVYMKMGENIAKNHETIKIELLKNPNIFNVTVSSNLPTDIANMTGGWDWEGEKSDEKVLMSFALFGLDYIETFKMQMVEGRFYSKEFLNDDSIVVNEKAVKTMGLKLPLGKRLSFIGKNYKIIGVVKDFHLRSLHHEIKPLVLMLDGSMIGNLLDYAYMFIRINPKNVKDAISYLESIYKKMNPGFTFQYKFLSEDFDNLYLSEKRMGKIFSYFTFLAIFVSCLGLLGLASFMTDRRTKEIAVRKVFGASVFGVVSLLSREFTKWVLLANIIAWPIVYYAIDKWLEGFANRVAFSWWTFIIAAVLSFIIALLVVSYHTVKIAIRNPVDSLKYE